MPVTLIRQLHPRSRPTSPHQAGPRRPSPGRPTSPVRAALGVLGAALVLAGVVTTGLLLRQLWWLDVVAAEHSEDLVVSIRQGFAAEQVGSSTDPSASVGGSDAPTDGPAIVHLPTIGVVEPVLEGVGADVLDQGVLGHYPGTAGPGGPGTFAVAGHRTTYGRPLWALGDLRPGDPVVVETAGSFLVYEVRSLEVVRPEDVSVLGPEPPAAGSATDGAQRVVLTTCHPRFSAAERLVATAALDRSVPRASGAPPEISGEDDRPRSR